MSDIKEENLSAFLEFEKSEKYEAVGFSLGGIIAGIGKVAGIIKTGGQIVKGVSGIVRDLFGNKVRINRAFKDPIPYLKNLKEDLEVIRTQNIQLYNRLNEIEDNIIDAVEDSVNLDRRHTTIEDSLEGTGRIDENRFTGALFNLAELEYRPTKIPNIIYGFEGYISNFASKGKEEKALEKGKDAIETILLRSRILEQNFIKYRDLHEQEINLLVGQLLGLHKLASKTTGAVKTSYDYKNDEYTVGIKGINDFDVNKLDKPPYIVELYELHSETKERIKLLVESLRLYSAMVKLIRDYNRSLTEDRRELNNLIAK